MTKPFSVYIHIPFCEQKCSYCGFYSFRADTSLQQTYCEKLIEDIKRWGGRTARPVSSIYFGGGTPSILKKEYLADVLSAVFDSFSVMENAEITLEANPADNLEDLLDFIRKAGFNRLSVGVQSADDGELAVLGRRHDAAAAERTVKQARKSGFNNISLDLMIGLPESSKETLEKSLEYVVSLNPEHISAYILKLEENTALFEKQKSLNMPNDDETADQYLFMCEYLESRGYEHYEISNFAKPGYASRHNSAYWQCREYLGFGPAAYSFFEGKRFHYQPNICDYLNGASPIQDGPGGDEEEYIMLGLRLKSGIDSREYRERFGHNMPEEIFKKAALFMENGLCFSDGEHISLTNKGMLVSNSIIISFIEEV